MVEIDEIAGRVAALLTARRETITIAESSTGGLISSALLAVPGASRYFLGGAVVYTVAARAALLGITPEDMTGMRASTEPYAKLLAERAREKFAAGWSLAETGATGPTGNRYGDAPGHVCLAVSSEVGGETVTRTRTIETGSDDRVANMRRFAAEALGFLEESLQWAGLRQTDGRS